MEFSKPCLTANCFFSGVGTSGSDRTSQVTRVDTRKSTALLTTDKVCLLSQYYDFLLLN